MFYAFQNLVTYIYLIINPLLYFLALPFGWKQRIIKKSLIIKMYMTHVDTTG